MKIFSNAILFLLLITCICCSSGCKTIDSPTIQFKDSRISEINSEGVRTEFVFNAYNPNPFNVDISNYSYNIKINGRTLLSDTNTGFTLSSFTTKEVVLPVFVRYEKFIDSALGIIAALVSGNNHFEYEINGNAGAGAFGA